MVGLPHTLSYRFNPILFRKPKVIIGRVNAGTQPSSASVIGPPGQQFPVVTIHIANASGIPNASGFNGSIEEVTSGQLGVFVLSMKPQILPATTFTTLTRNRGHDFHVKHVDNDLMLQRKSNIAVTFTDAQRDSSFVAVHEMLGRANII